MADKIEFTAYTTYAERVCLTKLVEAWNAFVDLPREHSDEVDEFRHKFHDLQRIVMTRPIRRRIGF